MTNYNITNNASEPDNKQIKQEDVMNMDVSTLFNTLAKFIVDVNKIDETETNEKGEDDADESESDGTGVSPPVKIEPKPDSRNDVSYEE